MGWWGGVVAYVILVSPPVPIGLGFFISLGLGLGLGLGGQGLGLGLDNFPENKGGGQLLNFFDEGFPNGKLLNKAKEV